MEWDNPMSPGRFGLRLVSELSLNVDSTHSERLLWGIHEVLQSARWKLEDIDLFGVGVGPGSFTGLRIGVTTARTLAHSLNKPLVGVSSLAALARPVALWASEQRKKTIVIAATDACKGELFALWGSARSILDCACMAEGDLSGLWKRGVEETVMAPPDLMKAIKKKLSEGGKKASEETSWVVVGEGRVRYPEAWKDLPRSKELQLSLPFSEQVQGRYVGLLAWEAFQAGVTRDALAVHPRYIRASDAEIKLRAGLLPPAPTGD